MRGPSPRHLAVLGLLVLGGLVPPACATTSGGADGEGGARIGLTHASSEPPPGMLRPVDPADRAAILARGRLLEGLSHAVDLAWNKGMPTAGPAGTDLVLPLADLDPGGLSGQVVFVRWKDRDVPDAANPDPALARRWLLVSFMLGPDRIMDVELLQGTMDLAHRDFMRVAAIVSATRKLAEVAPGARFRFQALLEQAVTVTKGPVRTHEQVRVYAFGAGPEDPDYELVLDPPTRREPARVTTVELVHRPEDRGETFVRTPQPQVGPMTIARGLERARAGAPALSLRAASPKAPVLTRADLPDPFGTGLVRPGGT